MSVRVSQICAGVLAILVVSLGGCGEDSGGTATGGATGSGGALTSGGAATQGGAAPGSGGATAFGGSSSGGATTAGGALTSGGSTSGGVSNTGGVAGATSGGASSGNGGSTGAGTNQGGASGASTSGGASTTGGTASGGVGGVAGATSGGASSGKGGASGGGAGNQGGASGGSATGGAAGGGTTPVKVWIAGDSTVQSCSSACPCGWGGAFDALFNDKVTVQNSAVGGRSVQTWLYESAVTSTLSNGECTLSSMTYNARWTNMTNATSGMKAGDYLFIQFGINDGDSTCPRHVGLTLFKSLFGAMAQAAKDRGAQPIFLTPVSAIQCGSGSMSNTAVGTRGSYVTATKEAGATYNVPVIDLHQLSVNLYNTLKLCPNDANYGSGAVGAFFCADHTHFEAAGAQQIAEVVAKALKDQGIPLAAYLK